jgi:hypothetical protein
MRDAGKCNEAGIQAVLQDPMSTILIEGEGGAIFVWRGPWIFEVHLMLGQRGREAMSVLCGMFRHMREAHGARQFWAAVPWDRGSHSRKVRLFARAMNWKSEGRANTADGFCELFTGE